MMSELQALREPSAAAATAVPASRTSALTRSEADTRHAGWSLMAAALAAALYAGFRFNECLGTDLVLAREPASAALTYLHVLNAKRTPAVLILVALSLVLGGIAVRRAQPRRLAAMGLSLLLVEDVLTFAVHIPVAMLLQRIAPDALPPEWGWLRARYVFDDVARTLLLVGAAITFIAAGIRNVESASLESNMHTEES